MSDTSPEQPLDSVLSPRGIGQIPRTGGYINRFKFQRERLKALQTLDDKFSKGYPIKKALPKLSVPQLERDDTNLSSISSKSIETIKLPSVPTATGDSKTSHYVKHKPPVRPLHLRLYPDHFSRIARSLPSLPSIPGSPGPGQANATPDLSPDAEETPEPQTQPLVIPSQHRYEVIAFQKTIHPEKRDIGSSGTKLRFRKHILYHLDESPRKSTKEDDDKKKEEFIPIVIKSPIKYRRRHRMKPDRARQSKSDGAMAHKKWKEDCGCLRCQIIKRQWNEGDALYKIWGEYPCHHVDPKAVTEDDD